MDKFQEKIRCIKSDKLREVNGKRNWLQSQNLDNYLDFLRKYWEFRVRWELEQDPNYKQIIPQIIFQYIPKQTKTWNSDQKIENSQNLYFLYKQKNTISESRLASLCPLFVWWHVEIFDNDGWDIIQNAIDREVDEEVFLDSKILDRNFKGIIYIEDENPVNHVHIGLAYIYTIDGQDLKIKETDKLEDIWFVDKKYLFDHIDSLTYWSRLIIDYLD